MAGNFHLLALLIDGDNFLPEFIPQILRKVNEYGERRISKVFHNKTTIEQWEQIASEYSIEPIWVPNNIKQKNTVDIALVMDAMILRYERSEITGFCIVASDSDYTRLARYLKSQGKFVLGIGEKQTPMPFRNACTTFIDIDDLVSTLVSVKQIANTADEVLPAIEEISDSDFLELFIAAYSHVLDKGIQDEKGRVRLRDIKDAMQHLDPLYSSREYRQMPKLIKQAKALTELYPDNLTLEEQQDGKSTVHYVYIKPVQGETFGNEIGKFLEAYKHATEVRKLKDNDGWVMLALIGEILVKLYPDYEPLIYRDVRHGQLIKVVRKMMVDYPNAVELKTDGQAPQIRMK